MKTFAPIKLSKAVTLATAALAIGSGAGYASAESFELEEIIVTAQKRAESLQDVPIAISALSGDQIRNSGADNLEGLSDSLPNVDIANTPGTPRVVIRGLGSGTGNRGFEQSVGMYVDGIYASRSALFLSPFLDMDRVEVLKGPQGVLFGKNSIAGAISLISKKPTDEFEAEISASYEFEHDSHEVTGIVSGPLTEGLYGRLAVKTSEEGAYMDNDFLNEDVPVSDTEVIRGTLVWEASDSTDVMLKLETSSLDQNGSYMQGFADYSVGTMPWAIENGVFVPTSPKAGLAAGAYSIARANGENYRYDDNSHLNVDDNAKQNADNVTLQITHELGDHELVYLMGYGAYDRKHLRDSDFTASTLAQTLSKDEFDQISHEIRLVSPGGETVDYIVGLYYLDQNFEINSTLDSLGFTALTASDLAARSVTNFEQDTTSYSAFAQATWNITDSLRTSFGLRYSKEEKSASNSQTGYEYQTNDPLQATNPVKYATLLALFNRPDFSYEDDLEESNLDPVFNIQWDYSDNGMAYLSWTKASKASGFNATETAGVMSAFSFDEESATSIELGIKTELLDGRARFNAAVFRTEFDDLQVGSFDPSVNGIVVSNAAKSITQGIEVEAMFAVTNELTVGGSAAYLNAEYDEFIAACPTNAVEAAKLDCYQDPNPAAAPGRLIQDLSGEQLDNAPEITAALFVDYSTALKNGMKLGSRLDATYKDETSLDFSQDSNLVEDDYWRINARFSLDAPSDKWSVALSLFNITDEQPMSFGGQTFATPGTYWANRARGREVELSATYRFGL